MNKEKQTIHEFDKNIIHEYYSNVDRQGPGSPQITIKALSFINGLTENSQIADIGCGTGGQTMVLAQNTPSKIVGIDLCEDFINRFNENVQKMNLQNKLKGIIGNMDELPFQEESLDLIWCEGAIYSIGFKQGLNKWKKFLKKGGYIAITENTWFTEERPSEINEFWENAYPEIDTIANKVNAMQKAGYLPIATFTVPESCWLDYYAMMKNTQKSFLEKYKGNNTAEKFIEYQRYEAELYNKYKAYYGYAFYIGKKI